MSRRARAGSGQQRRARLVLGFASALVVLALDQVTKSLAVADLSSGPVHLLGPLSLRLEYNSGIAFSLGTGLTPLIVAIVVVLAAALVYSAMRVETRIGALGNGMALGGALGNLADRLFRGHGGAVVDFIHTSFWPTFNLADASIVIGCVLLAIGLWRAPAGAGATTRSGAAAEGHAEASSDGASSCADLGATTAGAS